MTSVVLALAASVSWGVSDFLGGWNSRRLPLRTVLLISQAVGLVLLLALASLRGASQLDAGAVGFAVAGSLVGLIGIAAMYRGMAIGSLSIVGPISATGVIVPVLFGVLRGERATPLQAAGSLVALIGIVLASRSRSDTSDPRATSGSPFAHGVGFAIVAALGFGGFFVLLHEASTRDVLWAGVVQRATGLCVMIGVALMHRPAFVPTWSSMPSLVLTGVLDTGANVLYAYASTLGQVSLAALLASLFPVVTVILARVVLRERLSVGQGAGVVCALAGVALIALP